MGSFHSSLTSTPTAPPIPTPAPKIDSEWVEIKSEPVYIDTVEMTQNEWDQLKSLESANIKKTDISRFKHCQPYVPTDNNYPDELTCSEGIERTVFKCKKINDQSICRWQSTHLSGLCNYPAEFFYSNEIKNAIFKCEKINDQWQCTLPPLSNSKKMLLFPNNNKII
jgi:hypothetical protein